MKPLAVFTITQNEPRFLEAWAYYYMQHVPAVDLYVLDHGSVGDSREAINVLREYANINVIPVCHDQSYDSGWLVQLARAFQQHLLCSYRTVIFAATDEFIVPRQGGDLVDYLRRPGHPQILRPVGYEVVHHRDNEPALDLYKPWLPQRRYWYACQRYSKPVVCRLPTFWAPGFYTASNCPPARTHTDSDLLLLHLHRIDYDECLERHRERASRWWHPQERRAGEYRHNLIEDPEQLSRWILCHSDRTGSYAELAAIPVDIQALVEIKLD